MRLVQRRKFAAAGLTCHVPARKLNATTAKALPDIRRRLFCCISAVEKRKKLRRGHYVFIRRHHLGAAGRGVQKGQSEFYRGVPMDVTLLPKVKVEVVVSRVPVRSVIDVTKRVLYTGHIGDGKIFVYNVENVVKVRTGEEGVAALQDTH